MTVTGIVPAAKGRNRIYIDEEYVFFLYSRELCQYPLREGQPVSQELVDHILSHCILKRAKQKAMNLLQRQDYSVEELRWKLKSGEYTDTIIGQVMQYLVGYHYVDDVRYARQYITFKRESKSRFNMVQALTAKRIAKSDIEQAFSQLEEEEQFDFDRQEEQLVQKLLEKKLEQMKQEPLEPGDWNKVYQFLARKGFPSSLISTTINNYRNNKNF